MKHIILLVGPPGSGKSSYAHSLKEYVYINQDTQGDNHLKLFKEALLADKDIVLDRMNFSKEQRWRYLGEAEKHGYRTQIVVLHESKETCMKRCLARTNHPTIKNEKDAGKAINFFFNKYERVEDGEAGNVVRLWPEGDKPSVVIVDIDGTIADVEHRRHFVNGSDQSGVKRRNWKGFFEHMKYDTVKDVVMKSVQLLSEKMPIVYCSGRPDDYRELTQMWLNENDAPSGPLYMRSRNDMRKDNIIKEVILDFELLTRYNIFVAFDDRDQVVKMLRNRGITVFQVAEGNF